MKIMEGLGKSLKKRIERDDSPSSNRFASGANRYSQIVTYVDDG